MEGKKLQRWGLLTSALGRKTCQLRRKRSVVLEKIPCISKLFQTSSGVGCIYPPEHHCSFAYPVPWSRSRLLFSTTGAVIRSHEASRAPCTLCYRCEPQPLFICPPAAASYNTREGLVEVSWQSCCGMMKSARIPGRITFASFQHHVSTLCQERCIRMPFSTGIIKQMS